MAKLKMRPGKFAAIVGPLTAVALAAAIALPIAGDMFSVTLDSALGQGALHVQSVSGSENWDTAYINKKFTSDTDTRKNAVAVNKAIADEGIVLLKNNNAALPLAKSSTVSPFGYAYITPTYGGSGSGNVDASKEYIMTPKKSLAKNFTINETADSLISSATAIKTSEADGTSDADKVSFGGDNNLHDFDISSYATAALASSCKDTTAIVFIGRGGGEGQDIKSDGFADGTKHRLALSSYEKATIDYADANCAKVIVIIDSSNTMELGDLQDGTYKDKVDAIVWVGGPGANGFESMSDILVGDVNPSGRTADTYARDFFKGPSFKNFGDYTYGNATYNSGRADASAKYVQYEDGIYVGYRYYETASDLGAITYANEVVYPFGYGLSYTSFTQELESVTTSGNTVTAKVKVTNSGNKKGKEVVQIYYGAPYTTLDQTEKVEKSSKNLIAFGKTSELNVGSSEEVTLTWGLDEMASYDYMHKNADGTTGCYLLEAGDYNIVLGKNSHEAWDNKTLNVGATTYYGNKNARQSEKDAQSILDTNGKATGVPEKRQIDANADFVAATNEFQLSSDFMNQTSVTNLSRSAWSSTFPTAPVAADNTLGAAYLAEFDATKINGYDVKTNAVTGNVATSKVYTEKAPTYADNSYSLSALRGKSYYSSEWDSLLAQVNFNDAATQDELRDLLYYGAYNTAKLTAVGKPSTKDYDGPQGFSSFMDKNPHDWTPYVSEVVVASTFNATLVKEYGEAIGQEALANSSGTISGWYGPAMNTHRSPFAGRNFEYYSEDGLLAGKMAASVISGAANNGLYAYMKHFAMNDQETNRTNYLCTWATEQTIREIYLKPFEICAKEARASLSYTADAAGTKATKTVRGLSGVMTAFNCIGPTMASSNYALTNSVLRDEWGFQGMVITDFGPSVSHDEMVRAGNDFKLNANWGGAKPALSAVFADTTSATAQTAMLKAVKNMCFTVVNSNAFNGIAPGSTSYRDISPWKVWLYVATGALYALAATGACFISFRLVDEKKHPDKYQPKKEAAK
jgi:beta-glucosidase